MGDKKKKLDISKPIDKFIYDWGGGMFKRFGSVEEIDKYLCDMRDAISELIKKEREEVREEIRKQLHLQSIRTTWIDEMDGELLLKVIGDLPRGKPDNYFIIITKDALENI